MFEDPKSPHGGSLPRAQVGGFGEMVAGETLSPLRACSRRPTLATRTEMLCAENLLAELADAFDDQFTVAEPRTVRGGVQSCARRTGCARLQVSLGWCFVQRSAHVMSTPHEQADTEAQRDTERPGRVSEEPRRQLEAHK